MILANIIGISFGGGSGIVLPSCAQDLAISWHKNLNNIVTNPTTSTVEGLLDFDGVNNRVSLIIDITGNQTVSFKCYLDSSRNSMALIFKDNDSDYLWFEYSDGTDFCVDVAGVHNVYTSPLSLNGQTVDIEIIKTTGALTSLSINGNIVSTQLQVAPDLENNTYVGFYVREIVIERWSDGLLWDLNVSGAHAYTAYPAGNTNTAWEDTIGAIDGFISGSPALANVEPISYYIKDNIGTRTDDVYYGQYLDSTSGQINFYRTSGTFDYTDPSDGTLIEGVSIPGTGLYTIPANGICDIGVYPKTIEDGIPGVLNFDGSSYVAFNSSLVIEDVDYMEFNAYINEIPSSTELLFSLLPTNDGINVYIKNDGYLYASPSMNGASGTKRRIDVSGNLNNIITIRIVKNAIQSINSILIDTIDTSESTSDIFDVGSSVNRIGANGSSSYGLSSMNLWNINIGGNYSYLAYPNGDTDNAWIDLTGSEDGTVQAPSGNIDINPENNSIVYTAFYPVCERAGTVLHDITENSYHISVATPSWDESLYGSDYLNQCGFITKEVSDALGYDWESIVNTNPITLNNDTLVPLGQWEYFPLLDVDGDPILDVYGDPIYTKDNI